MKEAIGKTQGYLFGAIPMTIVASLVTDSPSLWWKLAIMHTVFYSLIVWVVYKLDPTH